MGLRFEAWTLPWSASFERKIADLPVVEGAGQGVVRFNDFGDASIGLPPGYGRLDEIISDTTGSLIRVYDDSTLIQEFLADRVEHVNDDTVGATISGPDLRAAFDRAIVYPYDYLAATEGEFPDWVWGGQNILSNPSFEESQEIGEKYDVYTDATGGTFTLTVLSQTTSAIAYNATPQTVETTLQALSSVDDVYVTGEGTETNPWRIEFVDPIALSTNMTGSGASLTGATDGLTIQLVEDGRQASENNLLPTVWTKNQFADQRAVIQLHGGYDTNGFRLSASTANTGTYSLYVNATKRYGGLQQVVNVKPGGTYQASIYVYSTDTAGAETYRLVIRDLYENLIAQTEYQVSTSNTWEQVTLADVVIPSGVDQVVFRFAAVEKANPLPFFVDDAAFTEGMAASNVGEIVDALLDDANTDRSMFSWLDWSGFSATLDSSGAAWDADISVTAYRGMSYGQFFDRLVDLGYEWDLTAKATPSGGLTHDLHWYNSGNRDAAPAVSVTVGMGTTGGTVVKRVPEYNVALIEGDGPRFVERTDGTAITNFGRLETYWAERGTSDQATLIAAGNTLLSDESTNRTAVQAVLQPVGPHPRPLVNYKPGDTIYFQFPPALSKAQRRVQQVSWQNTEPATYQVTGSRVFDAESGAWEAIRKILRRFRPFEEPEAAAGVATLGGGGGMSTVLVAASDSLDIDKAKADFVCTGTNDQDTIQAAIDLVDNAGGFTAGGGVVWLAAGTYNVEVPASGSAIDVKSGITLRGFDVGSEAATYIQPSNLTDPGSTADVIRLRTGTALEHVTVYGFYSFATVRLDPGENLIKIRHCWLENDEGPCISGSSNDFVWVEDCYIFTNYGSADTTSAIYISGASTDWWINGCYIQGGWHGIFIDPGTSSAYRINITRNLIYLSGVAAIAWDSPTTGNPYGIIAHNHIFSCGYDSAGGVQLGAIHISSGSDGTSLSALGDSGPLSTGTIITGNRIEGVDVLHGIMLDGTVGHQVVDNWVENATQHGIYLLGSSDCHVSRNTILWPGTSDTYDGIHLAAGTAAASSRNYLDNNRVLDSTSGTPRYWRYGVNVAGTACYDNIIVGNDLRYASGATGTAIANSAGTATLLSWPSHGTYGDNFT